MSLEDPTALNRYGPHSPIGMLCESPDGIEHRTTIEDLLNIREPLITPLDIKMLDKFFETFKITNKYENRFLELDRYLDLPTVRAMIASRKNIDGDYNKKMAAYNALVDCITSDCIIPKKYKNKTFLHKLSVVSNASYQGHLPLLKWAVSIGCLVHYMHAVDAASSGHLHVLQWMYSVGVRMRTRVVLEAAKNGYVHILEWMNSVGVYITKYAASEAAYNGYLPVIKYLHSIGIAITERCSEYAAYAGHVDILAWLYNNGIDYCYNIEYWAITNEQLNVLKYLHSIGYTVDQRFAMLAKKGHPFEPGKKE